MKEIRIFVALSAGVLWSSLLARQVQALPSLTPHRNVPGTIFWEEDGTEDGSDNHNHLFDHDVRNSTLENHVHNAFACWDNRTYRYDVGAATIVGGLKDPFFHCFIESGNEPRYKFIDGTGASTTFDATSKGIIGDAVDLWVETAKAQSKGKKTEDGSGLVTGIGLESTSGDDFEIRIGFFDGLIEKRNALGEWLVSDEQIWNGSGLTVADLDTSPILAFDDDIDWLFDTTKTPMGNQRDFFTIALHE